MNLAPPRGRLDAEQNELAIALKIKAGESMRNAVEDAVELNGGDRNSLTVAVDGTWLTRGHHSKIQVTTATSPYINKVLDVEPLVKYCNSCKGKNSQLGSCDCNYRGSSGGMEGKKLNYLFKII